MLRFAPSPTGFLHMGNIRVALINYLFAKKNNLSFFLRIDDTDQERSRDEFIESIIEDLEWLGIGYKKIIRQSKKYHAHDENNEFNVGDTVSIIESRPISKLKTWTVISNNGVKS